MQNQNGIFRNVNILAEINSENASQAIDIYTPGFINPYDIVSGVKYSGFITSLRMVVDINSVDEFILPETEDGDTEEDMFLKEKEAFLATPHKSISFYLRNSNSKPILVSDLLLFNRSPYYFVPMMKYFTDNTTFDVAPDTVISIQMQDVGYGLLTGDDRIAIIGSAVEEASYIEPGVLVAE